MTNDINIMVVSDHGLTKINNSMNIPLNINEENYEFIVNSRSVVNLWPKNVQNLDTLVNRLKNDKIFIYEKNDIPAKWGYKNNNRASPLLVVARLGYSMSIVSNIYWSYLTVSFK